MFNRSCIIFCLLFMSCSVLHAQLTDTIAQPSDTIVQPTDTLKQINRSLPNRNFIKVNLAGLPLRQYTLQFERILNKRLSLAVGLRLMPSGNIPLLRTLEKAAGVDDPDFLKILRSVQISNYAITPEVRYYVGKKGFGRGFYIAPYYRYLSINLSSNLPVEINFKDDSKNEIKVSGKINVHNIGLMIGAQWMISKRLAIDWWILGAQTGFHRAEITGLPTSDFTDNQLKEIRDDVQVNFNNLGQTSDIKADKVKVTTNAFIAATGLRAGLCLGFRF